MSILSKMEIDKFIKYTEEQLDSERILYESKIISAVEKLAEEKGIKREECDSSIYAQQWMIINLPALQSEKSAMQKHHQEIMEEKFEYYNRVGNLDGLSIWVGSILTNIGFTDFQANELVSVVYKIGTRLYKKANS